MTQLLGATEGLLDPIGGWPMVNYVGMRVGSVRAHMRPVGITRPECLLACAQCLRRAGEGNKLFDGVWKSVMADGTIFLSLQDPVAPWRSVTVFIRCEVDMTGDGLTFVIDVHVPLGAFGDPTYYKLESSQSYMRGNQRLLPSLAVTKREVGRHQQSRQASHEDQTRSVEVAQHSREHQAMHLWSLTDRASRSETTTHQWATEYWGSKPQFKLVDYREVTDRTGEHRREQSERSTHTQQTTQTREGTTQRREVVHGQAETTVEVVRELSATAIGVDFTDAEMLLACWLADPRTGRAGQLVETVLHTAGALAEVIPNHVAAERARANLAGTPPWASHSLDDRFWNTMADLMVVESMGVPVTRVLVDYDGAPRAIDFASLKAACDLALPEPEAPPLPVMPAVRRLPAGPGSP